MTLQLSQEYPDERKTTKSMTSDSYAHQNNTRLCCCTCTWPSLYCHLWRFWVSSHTLGLGKDSPLSSSFLFPLTLFWECCLNRPLSCLRLQMVSCGVWPQQVSSGLRLNGSRASWSSGTDCSPTQSQNGLWGNQISKHKPNTLIAAVHMFILEHLEGLWAFRLMQVRSGMHVCLGIWNGWAELEGIKHLWF